MQDVWEVFMEEQLLVKSTEQSLTQLLIRFQELLKNLRKNWEYQRHIQIQMKCSKIQILTQ
ncbi:hypothetical protein A7P25_12950 [Achromobacter xylosoxidans]|nr:hypothetical protein A7P25_12950 [Achromobacter xylosoxidans]